MVAVSLSATVPAHLSAQCADGTPPPCRVRRPSSGVAPAGNTVAVLYLDNLSRDTADAYSPTG